MPEIGPEDIWIFIYRHKETRYTDLIKQFVGRGKEKIATQTFVNYKKELENQGKIDKKISKKTRRPVYYVPKEFKGRVQDLIDKRKMKEQMDKMSPEEFAKFKEEFFEEFFG